MEAIDTEVNETTIEADNGIKENESEGRTNVKGNVPDEENIQETMKDNKNEETGKAFTPDNVDNTAEIN